MGTEARIQESRTTEPGVVADSHACKRATVQWEEAKASPKAPASAPAAKRYVRCKKTMKRLGLVLVSVLVQWIIVYIWVDQFFYEINMDTIMTRYSTIYFFLNIGIYGWILWGSDYFKQSGLGVISCLMLSLVLAAVTWFGAIAMSFRK
jgi:hypothetical protein